MVSVVFFDRVPAYPRNETPVVPLDRLNNVSSCDTHTAFDARYNCCP